MTHIRGIIKFPEMTEEEQDKLREALKKAQEEALLKAREGTPKRTGRL